METLMADTSALPDCEGVLIKIVHAERAVQNCDAWHMIAVENHNRAAACLNASLDLSEADRRAFDSIEAKLASDYEALRLKRLLLSEEIKTINDITFATNAQRESLETTCAKNKQLKEKFEEEVRKRNVRLLAVEKQLDEAVRGFTHRRTERQQKELAAMENDSVEKGDVLLEDQAGKEAGMAQRRAIALVDERETFLRDQQAQLGLIINKLIFQCKGAKSLEEQTTSFLIPLIPHHAALVSGLAVTRTELHHVMLKHSASARQLHLESETRGLGLVGTCSTFG